MAGFVEHNLIVDLSEEQINLAYGSRTFRTEFPSQSFWDEAEKFTEFIQEFISSNNISFLQSVSFSLPVHKINYQVVTLPEEAEEKEQLMLLGLEIDRNLISKSFSFEKLPVTSRTEGEGIKLCDYIVMSAKASVEKTIKAFAKELKIKIHKVAPSFLLMMPKEAANRLTASAWVGESHTEIVIWGKDNPLAMTTIKNTGDQMGDINRFIIEYFDHVSDLELSKVRLYGPKMRDSALAFALAYPYDILNRPSETLLNELPYLNDIPDLFDQPKLPKPPISMTPRNITFIASALAALVLITVGIVYQAITFKQNSELIVLNAKKNKRKKMDIKAQQSEKKITELEAEKEFYLSITKRRTPWHEILDDIATLTPKGLWFERMSGSKTSLLISGKARTTDEVSALSINLNHNSKYIDNTQIVGSRDYTEQNRRTYNEFQLASKLKSPTGKVKEI